MNLKVRDLKKHFRQGSEDIQILRGISLEAKPGEVIAVLGQSGSGKTTLLSLLGGLDRADAGVIEMDGKNFVAMTEDERTRYRGSRIGIVFQSYHLVPHLTAHENVMLPLEILGQDGAAEKARALLEAVNLGGRLSHFPSQLSGGESQRVAMARALVTTPSLVLADEPSGHLDQETGRKVMDLFFKMVRESKATTLLVTHDPALAEMCDRRLVLRNGMFDA